MAIRQAHVQPENASERVTRLCRLFPFDRADLLRGELASASTAAPARRCKVRDYSHRRLIGAPRSHQFATAVGTLAVNHCIPCRRIISSHFGGLVARMDRPSFVKGKARRIAIAVSLQTSRVVALMLGVSQCFGFRDGERCIVTSFLPIFARR
jgi:hypothetical protein